MDAVKFQKSVHVYSSAFNLIFENTTKKEWDAVFALLSSEAEQNIFESLEDDYESYTYLLLDFKTVVMTVDHDVMRTWESVKDFILDTVKEVETIYFDRLTGGAIES